MSLPKVSNQQTKHIEIMASVNKDKIDAGDELVLTLTIRGTSSAKQPALVLPDFKIESTSRTTGFQLKTGLLHIPAVSYTHNGKTLRTKPLDIEVTPGKTTASDKKRKLPEIMIKRTREIKIEVE
ncbi:BatD family protein [Acidobacteriota bacterium]